MRILKKIAIWFSSALLVFGVFLILLLTKNLTKLGKSEEMVVRKVDVQLPPPPPPPPPIKIRQSTSESNTPSFSLVGAGSGPKLSYAEKPDFGLAHLLEVEQPEFDLGDIDFSKALTVDFPVLKVENLDTIPRALSNRTSKFPPELIQRGIRRVSTRVELIIDQNGRPYIKKIVDSVYPEMNATIREWVKNTMFTKPTKNGQPVQAIYSYEIIFNYGR